MIDTKKYNTLKKKLIRFEKQRERAAGALEQLLQQMKKEFGCTTIEAAKEKLKGLKLDARTNEKKFAVRFKKFERECPKFLELVEQATNLTRGTSKSSLSSNAN